MKKLISISFVLGLALMMIYSCEKEDKKQTYTNYEVAYLLKNNMSDAKRFTITYKHPDFANKTTEQYESIQDTFWLRFDAQSLDYLFLEGSTRFDTANYSVSIYVDSKLIISDSTSCDWLCDSTRVSIEYPLP